MQIDQFSLFFLIAMIATLLSIYLAVSVYRLRPSRGAVPFAWMMMFVAVWTGSIAGGMLAPNEASADVWMFFRMAGMVFSPVAWLFLVFRYTEKEHLATIENIILVSLLPVLSIFLFATNDIHHYFVTEINYYRVGYFLIDDIWVLGPYALVHLVYSYALVLAGVYFLLREAIRLASRYRQQAIALIGATVIPLAVNITHTFHLIPQIRVNYDPLGFVIAGVFLGWGVYFNQLFDLSPIARSILVENMIESMIVVNQHHQIVDMNPAAQKLFGIDRAQLGTPVEDVFLAKNIPPPQLEEAEQRYQTEVQDNQGRLHDYEIQSYTIQGRSSIRGKLITARDISEQKRIQEQLQQLAITDALTGLSNHRHFYELLDSELERSRRSQKPFSVIMFDIDLFKQINDTHGHLIGDQVLREIALIGKSGLREYDILCRYGGEEFAVILPDTQLGDATLTAERLRMIIDQNRFQIEEIEIHVTISLGVSTFDPGNPVTTKHLIESADKALYQSKSNGRNRVTPWEMTGEETD